MPLSDKDARLRQLLGTALDRLHGERLGVAVSGGGDSLALLYLLSEHLGADGTRLCAVTVDHGLRPDSEAEAVAVGTHCRDLHISHTILKWEGWTGEGNLQDQARRARQSLIADWAKERGIGVVLLGHTADDQAETVLMRLARASGVDGLSAMDAESHRGGLIWSRPLLDARRGELRDYLSRRGVEWIDDPSNQDMRFDRIKARHAMVALSELGIDTQSLCQVADNMRAAREALQVQTRMAAESIAELDAGDVLFDRTALLAQPSEIVRRLLVHALNWVSSAEYGPRRAPVQELIDAVREGRDFTLHGCQIIVRKAQVRVTREWQAVRNEITSADELWDQKWRLFGPENKSLSVRALGSAGLADCPDWRETGRPRATLIASPSVWRGEELVAAPLAGLANGWAAELVLPPNHFLTSVLSH